MLGEKLRPVMGAMAGVAAGFVAASIAAQRVGDEAVSPEMLSLIAAGCGGFGGMVGALFGSLFSSRLGAYWFWFLTALIGLGLAPLVHIGAGGETAPLWSAWVRGETSWMLLHSVGATLLAAMATIFQLLLLTRRTVDAGAPRFGIGEIGVGLVLLAAMGYGLHWLGAAPLVLVSIVAPVAGKQATMLALRYLHEPGGELPAVAAETAQRKDRWRGAPHS